eukprot:1605070-Prymnesium_polylepis.1
MRGVKERGGGFICRQNNHFTPPLHIKLQVLCRLHTSLPGRGGRAGASASFSASGRSRPVARPLQPLGR